MTKPDWILLNDKKIPFTYRIIRRLVWLFSPKYELHDIENLPEEPCVIVGNHSQMYGPIAGELYIPGKHCVWCAGEMMNRREVADYAFNDFWSNKPRSVRWLFRLFSLIIPPLSCLVFNSAHTIAVYHDARLVKTFRSSIDALKNGSSIVIFPEHYERHNNIICGFQDKFVDLARFYFKKTGADLSFVPVYLAPKLKSIHFGTPVRFDHDAPIDEERRRICASILDAITDIAVSLPEHTVVPYPNVPKRTYPKNIPLEVYANEKAKG